MQPEKRSVNNGDPSGVLLLCEELEKWGVSGTALDRENCEKQKLTNSSYMINAGFRSDRTEPG